MKLNTIIIINYTKLHQNINNKITRTKTWNMIVIRKGNGTSDLMAFMPDYVIFPFSPWMPAMALNFPKHQSKAWWSKVKKNRLTSSRCIRVMYAGGGCSVVSTRAFHLCDPGSTSARCSYQIKNSTLVTRDKSVSRLNLPNTTGFP